MEVEKNMGNVIINYIDKKVRMDGSFTQLQKKIDFHSASNLISQKDAIRLQSMLNETQARYAAFINMVRNDNMYPPKNNPPVYLETPKDWAECIIELISLIEIDTKQAFEKNLASSMKEHETTYHATRCMQNTIKECSPPCVVSGGPFRKVCSYIPPEYA
jgi:hypothetical protein